MDDQVLQRPPRVWIVLLNWNGWRDTLRCLKSLQALDYPNYHIVLVDNGSQDESIRELRRAHPKLHLIEAGRNLGFGGGNNLGMRAALEARADYVWLLNTDTVVDPSALTELVSTAESAPDIGAVGSVVVDFGNREHVQSWGGGGVSFWTAHSWHLTEPSSALDYLTAASVLLRRESLENVGLFDERFFYTWEDIDLSLRLRARGWRLAVAERSCVEHKLAASVGQASPLRVRLFTTGMVRFVRKHMLLPRVVASAALALKLAHALRTRQFRWIPPTLGGWWDGWSDEPAPPPAPAENATSRSGHG